MNLNLFKDKEKEDRSFVKDFMKELSTFVQKQEQKLELEDGFYQVVDFGNNSVFLQNMNTNRIFEEKNIPDEIKNKISNDYILKCENGEISIDKEKTDKFFNGMIDIKDFQKK